MVSTISGARKREESIADGIMIKTKIGITYSLINTFSVSLFVRFGCLGITAASQEALEKCWCGVP